MTKTVHITLALFLLATVGCKSISFSKQASSDNGYKQKVAFDSLEIDVDGERVDKPAPSLFTKIHATVRVTGNVKPEKIFRAAELSFTKYCSVSLTLAATADIRFSVIVNDIPYVKA